MVLGTSALPEATKKQLRLGALSDSVLVTVVQTAATGERKRRQDDGIVRFCQTQYKAFFPVWAPPVRKRTSESASRSKFSLSDSAEIASLLSGLGTSAAFTHTGSCTASWRGNTWALLVLPCFKGDPFTARRVSLSPVVRGQGRSRGGSLGGSWGSPKSQAPYDWLRSFPRDGLPLLWFASVVRDAGAWDMRPSGLSVKFVEPSSASSWSVFSFSGLSWAFVVLGAGSVPHRRGSGSSSSSLSWFSGSAVRGSTAT